MQKILESCKIKAKDDTEFGNHIFKRGDLMSNHELERLLEKLHDEVASIDSVDEKSLQLLRDLDKDIDELLDRSDTGSVLERLREAIKQFEVSHPALTSMLAEISNILSNAGI
jgi:hypothetical protein